MRPARIRPDRAVRPSPAARRYLAPLLLLLLLSFAAAGCRSTARFIDIIAGTDDPPPDSTRAFVVYLVGDGGDVPAAQEPALRLLAERLAQAGPNSAIVFLGDNIYPSGIPAGPRPAREAAEARLDAQLAVVDSFPGHVVFIPGNHDWGGAGLGGDPGAVQRQEAYVESRLDRGNTFLPDNALPGPAVVELTDSLTLVAIDTQWWLEDRKPFGDTGQYFLEQESEFLLALDDVLKRYSETSLIVVAHHPVFTNGPHGGYFEGRRNLNPINLIGRGYLGTPQDLSNYKYRRLRDGLLSIFAQHPGLLYAAGHEHALQYFAYDGQHHVVSGALSKTSYVEPGHGASFVDEGKGFAELHYYTDGSAWLSFWKPDADRPGGRLLYRTRVREANRPLTPFYLEEPPESVAVVTDTTVTENVAGPATDGDAGDPPPFGASPGDSAATEAGTERLKPEIVPDTADVAPTDVRAALEPLPAGMQHLNEHEPAYDFHSQGTITVKAGPWFNVDPFRRAFLGEGYRDVWNLTVEVPTIDLERTAGGLTPLQRGGGLQTASLRLRGGDGDEYVLRAISKLPERTLPSYLIETIAHDFVRDQVSAMHPYGAVMIPKLAEAAGIFHTHPTIVYVPDDARLGRYREEFGGTLALFEARPDEDQRDEDRFGNAENIIGTPKLFEEMEGDNDQRVDEQAYARARLLDMVIGDWDRHSDQWRWAAFEPFELDPSLEGEARTQGKVHVPIPRDRDFAFFHFSGPVATLARHSGVQTFRRLTSFFGGYHDLFGLNLNGAYLDRRLTSRLTKADWVAIAEDVRDRLTDAAIEAAVRDLPPPVFDYHGDRIIEALRERRDALPRVAARYADLLAHVVDVIGSDKHEQFEVTRLNDDETRVVVRKTTREGDVQYELFRRTFRHDETDEVRLYGLGGEDRFILRGDVRDGLLVRIVGGAGEDVFVDSSRVSGATRKTIIHDTVTGNTWMTGPETKPVRSDDPANNAYEMLHFERDLIGPSLFVGQDVDDGFEIGGGLSITEPGFRKRPYAARHRVGAQYGTRSRALHAFYEGVVVDVYRGWNGHALVDYLSEGNFRHFYGLGNETSLADRDRFHARLGGVSVAPSLRRTFWPFMEATLGPRFEYRNVEPPRDGRPTAFTADDLEDKYFAGFGAAFHIDGTDTLAVTQSGLRWRNEVAALAGVRNTRKAHLRLASDMSYFYTFRTRYRTTLAVRVGGAVNVGKFDFYHANTLGGEENLRGFRKTRFAGRHSFYQNVDLRTKLGPFNAYLTRGEWGVLGFLDNGRVWADGDAAGRWHQGYGGGVWVSPFYQLVVTATVGRSRESTLFDLSFGFLF